VLLDSGTKKKKNTTPKEHHKKTLPPTLPFPSQKAGPSEWTASEGGSFGTTAVSLVDLLS